MKENGKVPNTKSANNDSNVVGKGFKGKDLSAFNAVPNQAMKCGTIFVGYDRTENLDLLTVNKYLRGETFISHDIKLGPKMYRVHRLVQLSAETFDLKIKSVKPVALQIGDNVLIYRPVSTDKEEIFNFGRLQCCLLQQVENPG